MKIRSWFIPSRSKKNLNKTTSTSSPSRNGDRKLSQVLEENKQQLQTVFGQSIDFRADPIQIGRQAGLICYLESMTNKQGMLEEIRKPLASPSVQEWQVTNEEELESLRRDVLAGCSFQNLQEVDRVVDALLNGFAVLFVEGVSTAMALLIAGIEYRSIEEPTTQTLVRGPKDGFTENIYTNISLIRRRIKNPQLQFQSFTLGTDTQTKIVLAYVEGIIQDKIVNEIRKRIQDLKISAVLASGTLEELIQDQAFTPFPTILSTERPDSIAASLLEGKAAVLTEGTPFVLVAPTVMVDFFQSPDDYYFPYYMGTLLRLLRYVTFLIALLLPALFLAITTYHPELLPTQLLISFAAQREGVPFPTVVEVLLMELTFEIIREAGIRMPRAVGQAVSIVGALVIGQAAVEAGIVSSTMVIIVSLTGLSSFAFPNYVMATAVRILRFLLIVLASVLGLYGVVLGLIVLIAHLTSLRSFGIPYLAPVAPLIVEDMDDVFVRFPSWGNNRRPLYLNTQAPLRQQDVSKTKPPTPQAADPGGDLT